MHIVWFPVHNLKQVTITYSCEENSGSTFHEHNTSVYTNENFLTSEDQVERLCPSPGKSKSSDEVDREEEVPDKNTPLNLPEIFIEAPSQPKQNIKKCYFDFATIVKVCLRKESPFLYPDFMAADCDAVHIDKNLLVMENHQEKLYVPTGNSEENNIFNQDVLKANHNLDTTSMQSKTRPPNCKITCKFLHLLPAQSKSAQQYLILHHLLPPKSKSV